jgi:hypothetical protein
MRSPIGPPLPGFNALVRNQSNEMLRERSVHGSFASGQSSTIDAVGTVRRDERIIGPTGDIVLSFFGEPSWEAYDFLKKYVALRMELLKPSPPSITRMVEHADVDAAPKE